MAAHLEMWTTLRYLAADRLEAAGVDTFDKFCGQFTQVELADRNRRPGEEPWDGGRVSEDPETGHDPENDDRPVVSERCARGQHELCRGQVSVWPARQGRHIVPCECSDSKCVRRPDHQFRGQGRPPKSSQ